MVEGPFEVFLVLFHRLLDRFVIERQMGALPGRKLVVGILLVVFPIPESSVDASEEEPERSKRSFAVRTVEELLVPVFGPYVPLMRFGCCRRYL